MAENKKEKKWNISREASSLGESLKTLKPGDEGYEETLAAIEKCAKISESKWTTISTAFKNVATVIVCAGIGILAYSVDKSNEIPKNKFSKELFHKFFKA